MISIPFRYDWEREHRGQFGFMIVFQFLLGTIGRFLFPKIFIKVKGISIPFRYDWEVNNIVFTIFFNLLFQFLLGTIGREKGADNE